LAACHGRKSETDGSLPVPKSSKVKFYPIFEAILMQQHANSMSKYSEDNKDKKDGPSARRNVDILKEDALLDEDIRKVFANSCCRCRNVGAFKCPNDFECRQNFGKKEETQIDRLKKVCRFIYDLNHVNSFCFSFANQCGVRIELSICIQAW